MSNNNNYLINPLTGGDVWVHSTDFTDPQDWVKIKKTLIDKRSNKNKFYIGAGDNLFEFGQSTVFVKYKPTKLFNANFMFFGNTYEDWKAFLDCVYNELLKLDPESKKSFLDNWFNDFEEDCVEEDSEFDWWDDSESDSENSSIEETIDLGFGPCDEEDIKWAVEDRLKTLAYSYYEDTFIQHCLVSLGFTGYIEVEKYYEGYLEDYGEAKSSEINVAIFESDFDNVEILGILSPVQNEEGETGYQCPNCKEISEFDLGDLGESSDLVRNILKTGKLECHKCS